MLPLWFLLHYELLTAHLKRRNKTKWIHRNYSVVFVYFFKRFGFSYRNLQVSDSCKTYLYYVCLPGDRPWIYNVCVFECRCCPGPVSMCLGWGIWEAAPQCQRQLWFCLNHRVKKVPALWPPLTPSRHRCPAKVKSKISSIILFKLS